MQIAVPNENPTSARRALQGKIESPQAEFGAAHIFAYAKATLAQAKDC
jgi:hypothetical protein